MRNTRMEDITFTMLWNAKKLYLITQNNTGEFFTFKFVFCNLKKLFDAFN